MKVDEVERMSKFEEFLSICEKLGKEPEEVLKFMKYANVYVDECNIGENGFNTVEEIENWWNTKTDSDVIKIYDEYEGLENLFDVFE